MAPTACKSFHSRLKCRGKQVPGLGLELDRCKLDMSYKSRYNYELPDAYERQLLDVALGDKRLFLRDDELDAAWEIFTPLLHELEAARAPPERYAYGSAGPAAADALAAKLGVEWAHIGDAAAAAARSRRSHSATRAAARHCRH